MKTILMMLSALVITVTLAYGAGEWGKPGSISPQVVMKGYTTNPNKRPAYTSYTAGRAVCWKANGRLGSCGAVTAASGACTCN